jgi:phosphoglycolate phosphatase-like HAD superfamily hydrolase
MPLRLLLFDLDGTLMLSKDRLAQRVMVEALARMTRAEIDAAAFEQLDREARTARWLAREATWRGRLGDIDLTAWSALVERMYLHLLPRDVSWRGPSQTRKTLVRLRREGFAMALVTGVPRRIARVRLERLDLDDLFPEEQGAYGSEVEEREDLLRLALRRAGVGAEEAVEIGAMSCAHELGIHAIATAFDGEAEAAVTTMPELADAVRALAAELDDPLAASAAA